MAWATSCPFNRVALEPALLEAVRSRFQVAVRMKAILRNEVGPGLSQLVLQSQGLWRGLVASIGMRLN